MEADFHRKQKDKVSMESLLSAGKTEGSQVTSKHILILDTWFPLFFKLFLASWLSSILGLLLHAAVDKDFERSLTWETKQSHARGASTV